MKIPVACARIKPPLRLSPRLLRNPCRGVKIGGHSARNVAAGASPTLPRFTRAGAVYAQRARRSRSDALRGIIQKPLLPFGLIQYHAAPASEAMKLPDVLCPAYCRLCSPVCSLAAARVGGGFAARAARRGAAERELRALSCHRTRGHEPARAGSVVSSAVAQISDRGSC